MTDLPEINFQSVARKLAGTVADLTFQVTALEHLADSLVEQRNTALSEVSTLRQENHILRNPAEND